MKILYRLCMLAAALMLVVILPSDGRVAKADEGTSGAAGAPRVLRLVPRRYS
jgi:hypothetical protein